MAVVGPVSEAGENSPQVSLQVNPQTNVLLNARRAVGGLDLLRHTVARTPALLSSTEAKPYAKLTVGRTIAPAVAPAIPWWLWWNILSVDAPMVAVAWAAVFARANGGRLPVVDAVVLFLAVWAIYVSDRTLDCRIAANRKELRERHFFCERHGAALVRLLALASGVIFWLATEYLPLAECRAGLRLGVVVALYLAGIHAARGRFSWVLPKEIAVGTVFACGVTLPIWSRGGEFSSWDARVPWMFFAGLCCLNCLSIECWENRTTGETVATCRRLPGWPAGRLNGLAAALAGLALIGCLAQGRGGPFPYEWLAICFGALLLLVLNLCRRNFSSAALRVFADAALLLPAMIVLAMRGLAS